MEFFILPENKIKYDYLKAKEIEMIRQYEYNLNISKSMLINSNTRLKEQVFNIIEVNEKDLENKLSIYQRNMMGMSNEVMDKIITRDDYKYINERIISTQNKIMETFVNKYTNKLEEFILKEEKRMGNCQAIFQKKLESIIENKISNIKKMEIEYTHNIKKMYQEAMEEIQEYKENGLDVIVVEKKCLQKDHLRKEIDVIKDKIDFQKSSLEDALIIVNQRMEKMVNEINTFREQKQNDCLNQSNPKPNISQENENMEGFYLPLELKYYDPKFKTLTSIPKKINKLNKEHNSKPEEPIIDKYIHKNHLEKTGIFLKDKQIKLNKNESKEQLKLVEEINLELLKKIEKTDLKSKDSKLNNPLINKSIIRGYFPNYNYLLEINKNYADYFEITKDLKRKQGNWRNYVKSKVLKRKLEIHDVLRVLFEYTHKMNLWVKNISKCIENKFRINLPKPNLNDEEHSTEAFGMGYLSDDDEISSGVEIEDYEE